MDDLSDPSAIKIASIWVVWSFLALGILGWGLWVVLLVVGTQEAVSAWVQAIGSIGAILPQYSSLSVALGNSARIGLQTVLNTCRKLTSLLLTQASL